MNVRRFIKMCTLSCLAGLLALTGTAGLSLASGPDVIPMPFVLKAKLTANGAAVTTPDSSYTIKVKNTSGTEFQPIDTVGKTYGGATNTARFQYDIPTYDAQDQPNGAQVNQKACIEVYHNTTKLNVTYPAQGSCPAGSGQITVLNPGDSMGFGGISGNPNDASHTFATPLTAATSTPPTVAVLCGGVAKNSTTPESWGNVQLGLTVNDTSCIVKNTGSSSLTITALAAGGCGFSVASPTGVTTSAPISVGASATRAMTLAFAPCGKGVQTGTLTISSNDPSHGSYGVALTGTGVASVSLISGWNLIGLPSEPPNTTIGTVLSGIMSNVMVVWGYSGGKWSYYDPNDPDGSALKTLTIGNGYWIKMKSSGTLTMN